MLVTLKETRLRHYRQLIMNCHKYQCTGYSKHLEPKTISNTMQTTGTLASSEYQSDSKQDILTLNTNTPKKRHRRRFRPQSVERGTNVTEEFILAPDELKQQRKREKKITTKYLDGPAEDKELEVTVNLLGCLSIIGVFR